MNLGELRFRALDERDAGRAVGLVANYQVYLAQSLLLGGDDDIQRLVGTENHRPVPVGAAIVDVGDELFRRGGGRADQIVGGDFVGVLVPTLLLLPGLWIGADGVYPHGHRSVVAPFADGLGDQRDRRGQEQDGAAGRHLLLGYAERGVRLAGSAGHDQLAAVVLRKPVQHGSDGFLLVLPRVLLPDAGHVLGCVEVERVPING